MLSGKSLHLLAVIERVSIDWASIFLIGVCFLILAIAIPVAIARWVFRVNVQVKLLEQIGADLKTLVVLKKMRKH